MSVRDVRLTDESAFVFLKRETGWFKKVWIGMDTGNVSDIPVYSAAKGPIAHVDVRTPKLINADPDHPVFSFAVDGDGSAGSNFVLHTRPFYVSNKRATVAAVDDRIDLEYVLFALQSMKADYGFNYNYKAYSGHLQDVVVPVPVGADGRYDTAAQRKQVKRLSGLYTLRSRVSTLLAELTSVRVSVEGSRTSEQGRELDER